jgi:hypothetical protein
MSVLGANTVIAAPKANAVCGAASKTPREFDVET